MKTLALLLIFSLAYGQAPQSPLSTSPPTGQLAPLTIKAKRPESPKIQELKAARAAGGLAGAYGLGMMTYAVFFASAGPVGWAAGLLFVGGLTAYLSHRAIKGYDDFSPVPSKAARAPGATP